MENGSKEPERADGRYSGQKNQNPQSHRDGVRIGVDRYVVTGASALQCLVMVAGSAVKGSTNARVPFRGLRRVAELSTPVPLRILVVDDNDDAAFALCVLLEMDGHVAQQAGNGVAGYEMAEKFGPQVGILDLDMPERNGFELARLIREQLWGKSVLLIALTGHDDRVARARASASGFDMFVRKPIDPGAFASMIRRALTTMP